MDFEKFKILFPKVVIAKEAFEVYLGLSKSQLDKDDFGDSFEYAVGLLIAHIYTMNTRPGMGSGAIETETEGSVSITYSESQNGETLKQTKYGSQLIDLMVIHGSDFYDIPHVVI